MKGARLASEGFDPTRLVSHPERARKGQHGRPGRPEEVMELLGIVATSYIVVLLIEKLVCWLALAIAVWDERD